MLKYSTSGGSNARGLASGPASPWDTIGEGLFWCRSAEGRHYHICGTWKMPASMSARRGGSSAAQTLGAILWRHRFENRWAVVSPRSDCGVDPGAQCNGGGGDRTAGFLVGLW